MNQPLVTVVIPAYNAEKTIDRCLLSIIKSRYKNLEIIVIDDGSTDQTLEKCREWKKKDSRIKFLHQENSGVSKARNYGILSAKGKYITFVDADDYILPNMYMKMVECAEREKADEVVCGYKEINNSFERGEINFESKNVCDDAIFSDLIQPLLIPGDERALGLQSACNKLYLLEKIICNNILFDTKLKYAEDWLFNIECYRYLKNVYFLNEILYCYVIDTVGSLSKSFRPSIFEDSVYIEEKLRSFFPKFYENKKKSNNILGIQIDSFKSYAYYFGIKGYKTYVENLFENETLREAYKEKIQTLSFYFPKKAVHYKCFILFFVWSIVIVSPTLLKHYAKLLVKRK